MIVLDTHIWVWWVQGDPRLTQRHREEINKSQKQGIGICSISCLEVARLVERGRLGLSDEATQWLEKASTSKRAIAQFLSTHPLYYSSFMDY